MPSEPARHRMALWRELRRAGAVPIAPAMWAMPELPAVEALVEKAGQHTAAAGAALLVLSAEGRDAPSAAALQLAYDDARSQEWAEFHADCDKFLAEIDKEERIGKYTLAELEEEEQSLERLRRWYRDLRARDLLGTAMPAEGERHLKRCGQRLDQYAEAVYTALSQSSAEGR